MSLIIKKVIFLVGLTLYITSAHSQTVTSTRNGVWNDPTIWSGGFVPTSVNATGIVIDHEVELPSLFAVSAYNLIVNGKLTLKGSSQLTILPDSQTLIRDLTISGTLIMEDLATLNGTSVSNTIFTSGSTYVHRQGPLGFIPYAAWDRSSTFIINGFKDSGYINIAHSDSWKQTFGNVVYDCPQQTIFVVDLNGYLRNILGDFMVKNTNNKTLRLSTTQNPTISVGGSLLVEGSSEVWFSTNGTSATVNIEKDFKYTSTSSGPTYLTTRGVITMNIKGNLEWNSPGPLRMASSSADSLGLRRAIVNISGNLSITNGMMIAPPAGSGSGRITFRGPGEQKVTVSTIGSSFQGNLDYVIDAGSIVDLGSSVLSCTTGSLLVNGTLRVGSSDPQGAIQLVNKGNIHIPGTRRYEPGSTIEYNGSSPQWIGVGHPSNGSVNLAITNSTTTRLLRDILCHNIKMSKGTVSGDLNKLTAWGNVMVDEIATVDVGHIRLEGNEDQLVDVNNTTINNLEVNKSVGSVLLTTPMKLRGILQVESINTTVRSDGNLTLLSTSDSGSGSARVGTLPTGSRVVGDVTVHRYMGGEGRIFRYISSPVQDASVASLMDDFAVTGKFADPTTVNVSNSKSPSLYYYDESQGSLQGGWKAYPAAGFAKDSPLIPGLGYCALIRQGAVPIVWDVTGRLNQGDIVLPVALTNNTEPSNGWNLVGNPFACTIDWDIDGPNGWTKQNISPIFCIRDNGIGSWGTVRYWDGDVNYSDIPEGHIAGGQSFWVKATGSNPQLIAREGVKAINDAAYYRTTNSRIPSFVLKLKKDGYVDKAYFKVRDGASANYDIWDAIKMDNDNFDVSTLSDDGLSLAINSRDNLPCGELFVKVRMKDLKKGTYNIEIDTRFEFASYTYTWMDSFFNSETEIRMGTEIEIEISDDPASKSPDRFRLRLNELHPTNSQSVVAPSLVCSNDAIPLVIENSQAGVFYAVWEGGRQLCQESMAIGGDLTLEVNADSVEAGTHHFEVIARSACSYTTLISKPTVQIEEIEVLVSPVAVCVGETANLAVRDPKGNINYFWFEGESSLDTLVIGSSMTTPRLLKSQSFYVSGVSSTGCSSKRKRADVEITNIEEASIIVKDSENLCSNYQASNRWFYEGTLISTSMRVSVERTGTFVLVVDTLGCTTSDTIEFIYASVPPDFVGLDIHPNPVRDHLTLSPVSHPAQLEIVDVLGVVVKSGPQLEISPMEEALIDVNDLKPGTYVVVIRTGQRKKIMRFVKVE